MKSIITNAAEITVLRLIDNTYKTGGGPISVGASVVVAGKGPVGVVTQVRDDNWQDIFGKPLSKRSSFMEGLRHLSDAVKSCNYVNVVRVVHDDARFPSLLVKLINDHGAWASGHAYVAGDVVEQADVRYICILAHTSTSGDTPPHAADWEVWTGTDHGAWASGHVYIAGDIVEVTGTKYICILGHTASTENDPPDDVTHWEAWAGSNHGAWASGHPYIAGDIVTQTGVSYLCILAHTSSSENDPPNETNWSVLATTCEVGETSGSDGHPYGTVLSLGAGYVMEIWPIDGDPSVNRSFELTDVITEKTWVTGTAYDVNDVVTVTGGKLICITAHTSESAPTLAIPGTYWKAYKGEYGQRFTLNIYDKDESAVEYLLETYLVGIAPADTDDMGRPAFIETVLEQNSDRFRCNIDEDLTWATVKDSLKYASKTAFVGGTNGSTPETADWIAAWDLFRNETFLCHLMFAAGVYDEDVLANCIDIADERHCSFFFDVNPNLQSEAAIAWIKGTGLESRQAAVYYSPFAANDRWYGGKTVWGISGAAANACAKGDANMTGAIPGIHYAPAGIHRGMLERTGVKSLSPDDVINRDDFYDARINPVVAGDTGGAMIDDALTIHYKQNYSRFIWVNRIANYIDHRFVEAAAYAKFEPDGLTKPILTRLTKEILDQLVTSGALVTPRDTADGTNPYILTVKQEEIDLWLVTWDFCPTGAARRIAGQPRLIK